MQDEAFAWPDQVMPPATQLAPAAGSMPGLLGITFRDVSMTRPLESLTVSRLDSGSPNLPDGNDWGLRLRGRLTPPASGRITLQIESRHTVRLWLAGRTVIDAATGGGSTEFDGVAGVPLPIEFEYAQANAPADFQVTWRLPGRSAEAVPPAALSHDHSDRATVEATGVRPTQETLLEVANPDPHRLASLTVWRKQGDLYVRSSIPGVPGFISDSWCYEGAMEFLDCRDLGGGKLELRHKLTATPEILVVTEITPAFDSVTFLARLVRADGAAGPLPDSPVIPKLCWPVKPSPSFASKPEPYPAVCARCFMFTDRHPVSPGSWRPGLRPADVVPHYGRPGGVLPRVVEE
jgi:hypothetical protein